METHLGEPVAADHNIMDLDESRTYHRNALIVHDGYSYWLQSYPAESKGAQDTTSCLRRCLPPFQKSGRIFADKSKEFIEACQDLQWTHDMEIPLRSETNGSREELFDE